MRKYYSQKAVESVKVTANNRDPTGKKGDDTVTRRADKSGKLSDESRYVPYRAIANYTYDWETWVGPDKIARWINPAVERITGYSADECLDMPDYPLPLVYEEDREAVVRHLAAAARGESGNHEEFRIMRKDGAVRWGAVSWQPIVDAGGKYDGYRTSVRDITDTKRIESELRAAYLQADQADRGKTRFLAAASHDLRQPLQAISMFTAALRSTAHNKEDDAILSSIQECLSGANEILGALLDVSRLDAGVLKPQPQDFMLCDMMEKLEAEFLPQAKAKGLDLRFVASTAVVHSDPGLLGRIVGNLVANAVRYTETGRILVGCRRRGEKLTVEVWDTGPGIASAMRERIFEEYFQIGNPERDRRRGLGLGLAIAKRLARKLDAPITLESKQGSGSVFKVEMTLAPNQEIDLPPRREAVSTVMVEGKLIIVIENDPTQACALSILLDRWGCESVVASGLTEALETLSGTEERMPALILADYRLRGERTGAEAIEIIRRSSGRQIPGIIITGDTEPSRLAQAARSGFRLLSKPVDSNDLFTAITEALATDALMIGKNNGNSG